MPLVAIVGPRDRGPVANPGSTPAGRCRRRACAGGCSDGSGSARSSDRPWLAVLFGFSTQILWVTTRGGVWHTGHLDRDAPDARLPDRALGPAASLAHRALAGAAFLTRAPLAFAVPFYACMLASGRASRAGDVPGDIRRAPSRASPWRAWVGLRLGVCPGARRVLRSTTRSASGRRSNPAMRSRRCPTSSSASGRSACSRSRTCR